MSDVQLLITVLQRVRSGGIYYEPSVLATGKKYSREDKESILNILESKGHFQARLELDQRMIISNSKDIHITKEPRSAWNRLWTSVLWILDTELHTVGIWSEEDDTTKREMGIVSIKCGHEFNFTNLLKQVLHVVTPVLRIGSLAFPSLTTYSNILSGLNIEDDIHKIGFINRHDGVYLTHTIKGEIKLTDENGNSIANAEGLNTFLEN